VRLAVRHEGPEVRAVVEDTGIGIPPDRLPRIFERFQQAHGGHGGTGLGLAIVKAFMEAHGGRVWVESRQGEGTTFHLALSSGGETA
jgi:signal transduction histidine kinase